MFCLFIGFVDLKLSQVDPPKAAQMLNAFLFRVTFDAGGQSWHEL